MATTTICGKPSSWFVYAMGSASLIETIVFIVHYAEIISDINRFTGSEPWLSQNQIVMSAFAISIFSIVLNSFRCMFAVIVLFGQYMDTIKTLEAFKMFTLFGILMNIFAGAMGLNFYWTFSVSIGTLAVIALHIVYLILSVYICKLESRKLMSKSGIPAAPGHLPYHVPVQTAITVLPTVPNTKRTGNLLEQQPPYNPYVPPTPDMHYTHTPQSLPNYSQSSVSSGTSPYEMTNDKQ